MNLRIKIKLFYFNDFNLISFFFFSTFCVFKQNNKNEAFAAFKWKSEGKHMKC